uniref:Uncharacterized protein n=1 Tax=Loa loa TaxID=7209 RepID=A0A1I7VLQ1_LOALO
MSSRIFSSHFQDSVPSDLEPQFDLTGSRCNYQIKRNSIEGPLIRYASLGETVYHPYVHCPKNKERDTKRSRSTDAFVQAPPTKRTLAAQVTPGIAVEITSKESWNAATRELDLITLPAYSQSLTAITEASKTEELFFISTANDYGFDLVSSDPLPPSIHPTQRNSEEEIQVELSGTRHDTIIRGITNIESHSLVKIQAAARFLGSNRSYYPIGHPDIYHNLMH